MTVDQDWTHLIVSSPKMTKEKFLHANFFFIFVFCDHVSCRGCKELFMKTFFRFWKLCNRRKNFPWHENLFPHFPALHNSSRWLESRSSTLKTSKLCCRTFCAINLHDTICVCLKDIIIRVNCWVIELFSLPSDINYLFSLHVSSPTIFHVLHETPSIIF